MKEKKQNFMGMDGFLWFYGVVEDRQDPFMIGRVRVRCFGHHTGNKTDLPSEDLPWAQVMLPVTSAGISGIGQSPTGLVEGSHVFGFFRDGEDRQEPVVMGSLPGYPAELADTEKGFYDPNGVYPKIANAPDTNQLSTMIPYNPDFHPSITFDRTQIKQFQNIGTASVETMQLASAFISKGGGSLFGFVADIITSQVGNILGANVLGSVGEKLTGFTTSVTSGVNGIIGSGQTFLKDSLGLDLNALKDSTLDVISTPGGKVAAKLLTKQLPSADALLNNGFVNLGQTPSGLFELKVVNPATMGKLFTDAASTEVLNNYNKAEARVEAGLGAVVGSVERVIDPTVLGTKNAFGLIETISNQDAASFDADNQLAQVATGGSGQLIRVVDKVTGVTSGVVDDIGQDSISAGKTIVGDQGITIPQKSTASIYGVAKLFNNFIGSDSASWSMPEIPSNTGVYPKKHVYETESGHIMMYDDNEGNETIMQRHSSGTKYEIANDGTRLDNIVSDSVTGIMGSRYSVITEDDIITLDGKYKIFVNKSQQRNNNYDIVVGANANINIQIDKGDLNINILDGRINANCSENFNMIVGGDTNLITAGDFTVNASKDITLKGSKIYLN